jgi:hypothetical protein
MSDEDGGNRRRDAVFGTPLPPPGMPSIPQYGQYGGEPPTMPTWAAGEPLASPMASPLAPPAGQSWYVAPPPRKRRRGRAIIATVGAVAVLAGGTFAAVALSGSDGAATPSAAVAGFFDALDHEDVLGMLNALPAGERDALQPLAEELTSELERLGISKKVDLGLVKGLDVQVDRLETHSEDLGDGVAGVWIDSGIITVNVVPQDVPIGDNLKNLIEHVTGAPVTITATSDSQSMHMEASTSPIVTIKDGGSWKLSALYTMAESIRRDSEAALPAFGHGVDAVGSDSPEAAVKAFADAAVALDVEKMVALTPPKEMQALHDYAPLFLREVTAEMTDAPFSVSITRLDLEPSGSGDRQSVAVTGAAVHFESEEGSGDVDYDGKCLTLSGDLANFGEGGTEKQCPGDMAGLGELGLGDLAGRVGDPLAITVVKEDGEWYVSPIGTFGNTFLSALHVLQPEDFQDGGLVYKLIDGIQNGFDFEGIEGGD